MKTKITLWILWACIAHNLSAQNIFKAIVKDEENKEPLTGVNVTLGHSSQGAITNDNGIVTFTNIPNGKQQFTFKYLGYRTETRTFTFPLSSSAPIEILLEEDEELLEEVIITSTRSTRSIQNIPTRVEFISDEELQEKGSMKPGDIRMLLNESTGIITQQTSATSGNAVIRIQGLDGRYTQILKDGFPVFAGAASGLGLLQTPPLDLKQVEIIKGSTSTLYGGGAIAGLVNLISKTPEEERDLSLHLNGTTAKGVDANAFYSQRFNKIGTTLFASYNRNWAYAPSNTQFTAIPQFNRFTFNPKLFFYLSENTDFNIGINSMFESRLGGDIDYINNHDRATHTYFEKNKTERHSSQLSFNHQLNKQSSIHVKNSITYFNRQLSVPNYTFEGEQISSFSEATYSLLCEKSDWVTGINLWTEKFTEKQLTALSVRDYNQTIAGAFLQNNYDFSPKFALETGLRADYIARYGACLLPRVSAHFKPSEKFSSRLGCGFGYKAPTIFTEESEKLAFKDVLPIDKEHNKLERSYGANIDFNYLTPLFDGEVTLSINQLFFYTYLSHPLLLQEAENNLFRLNNISGHTDTKGGETNVKLSYKDLNLYVGYTYTDVATSNLGVTERNLLTPQHRLNTILMYEEEDNWKIGLEAYYFSRQRLSNQQKSKQYVVCGFMIEKIWEKLSLYANFENFTDRRQTRFENIYTGSPSNPLFKDIYAPLDGFVMNAGIKLRF